MVDRKEELAKIIPIAVAHGVDPYFILTIRLVENGGPGREFGVLSISAPTWTDQCRVACVSVAHRLVEFQEDGAASLARLQYTHGRLFYGRDFILYFAQHWAPEGAANDPDALNRHWADNAIRLYRDLCSEP